MNDQPPPRRQSLPRSVSPARAELRTAPASWGLSELEEAAVLVLSELLTNAGQHARVPGREIETRFLPVADDGVRIEVHDASDVAPQMHEPERGACGGRGLVLVAALAERWGYGRGAGRERSCGPSSPPLNSAHDLRTVPKLVALLLGAATSICTEQGRSKRTALFSALVRVRMPIPAGRPPRNQHPRGESPHEHSH
ncbi:ATP-binding protein [Streptomyces sp. NPDC001832]|uniref:ATP-binding protein n=1 Tax=Streptomyces sp. NPDC001832 TaxID=3154527 RepID=UPI00331BE9BB